MFGDGSLTFREFATRESLPLAIHDAVLAFLRGRTDAVLCGAHAVNAYVAQPRMSDDVDIVAVETSLAAELCDCLKKDFDIPLRAKPLRDGAKVEIHQIRRKPRRLVDLWRVTELPPARRVKGVLVLAPSELIACKLISLTRRKRSPAGGTDEADILRLLLAFPALKRVEGAVANRLRAHGVGMGVFAV